MCDRVYQSKDKVQNGTGLGLAGTQKQREIVLCTISVLDATSRRATGRKVELSAMILVRGFQPAAAAARRSPC
jgi:hypothetical protein